MAGDVINESLGSATAEIPRVGVKIGDTINSVGKYSIIVSSDIANRKNFIEENLKISEDLKVKVSGATAPIMGEDGVTRLTVHFIAYE